MVRIEQIREYIEMGKSLFTIKMFNKFDKLCQYIEKYMLTNCRTPCHIVAEARMVLYKDKDDGELWINRSLAGINSKKYRNIGDNNATYMNVIKTDIINEMITKNETGTFSENDYHLLHSWGFMEEHHDTLYLFEIFKIIQSDE
jgi:hypothetical protein